MQALIKEVIRGISNSFGNDFFERMTLSLDKVIESDYLFIARLDEKCEVSNTVCLVSQGQMLDNFQYLLKDTPCENVVKDTTCIYPDDVASKFPNDQLLVDMGIRGYLGSPLHDSHGKVLGLIVALYKRPVAEQEMTFALFELFSGRIAVEFERLDHERRLIALNESLDRKVEERTAELAKTIAKLTSAHDQLIESEKMAALGDLISGVAHEVNTPLGVAITATSLLVDNYQSFKYKLDAKGISRRDMDNFIEQMAQSLPLLEKNLSRAKLLIENFKKTAKEQQEVSEEQISLSSYFQRVVSTLNPILKRKNVQITLTGGECVVSTYPGYHAQILTNLVSNSVQHGFVDEVTNTIDICICELANDTFQVEYKDNGTGIPAELIHKVVEPFFTTKRVEGATGLGLSICHNLATNALHGSFNVYESEQGAHITYTFSSTDKLDINPH